MFRNPCSGGNVKFDLNFGLGLKNAKLGLIERRKLTLIDVLSTRATR